MQKLTTNDSYDLNMYYDLEKTQLRELFLQLQELPLPTFTLDDELSDWIEDLIAIDSYYAGLALSAIGGEIIPKSYLHNIQAFRNSLDSIQSKKKQISNENQEILNDCHRYLDLIQTIDTLLRKLSP